MKPTIVIIQDEPGLLDVLQKPLEEHYTVQHADDGWAGLDLVQSTQPDLVLLDLLLPGVEGWEVCRRIRQQSDVPIIVLTGLGHEQHIIRALDLGADDYVTRPFRVGELMARMRAVLRRGACAPDREPQVEIDARLRLDRTMRCVVVDGASIPLSVIEYELLSLLVENGGRILTHDTLLARVWGWDQVGQTQNLKAYIYRLRQKIEVNPSQPAYILTERGVGYRFQVPTS